jgi:hypothetical protein
MTVGELRSHLGENAIWVQSEHQVRVEVRLPDGSTLPCDVTGFQNTTTDGRHVGQVAFVLIASPEP